jgi:hypothetical protein
MNRVLAALALMVALGCTTVTTTNDLSVLPPGCRAPSACWANSCSCMRATFVTECLTCDPTAQAASVQTCDCQGRTFDAGIGVATVPSMCLEPSQVCVGRAPIACPGFGARCLPAGTACSGTPDGGVPPDVVAITSGNPDAGPGTEQRCSFYDDVCCPGSLAPPEQDLGTIDANLDQSTTD